MSKNAVIIKRNDITRGYSNFHMCVDKNSIDTRWKEKHGAIKIIKYDTIGVI